MQSEKTVEDFIAKQDKWKEPLLKFREIMLATELTETVKWGSPVHTLGGKHVAGMGAFKSYVGIWFFHGALLSDPKHKLVNAQEGKTKALRQLRFADSEEIDYYLVKAYVEEVIQNQKQEKKLSPTKRSHLSFLMS